MKMSFMHYFQNGKDGQIARTLLLQNLKYGVKGLLSIIKGHRSEIGLGLLGLIGYGNAITSASTADEEFAKRPLAVFQAQVAEYQLYEDIRTIIGWVKKSPSWTQEVEIGDCKMYQRIARNDTMRVSVQYYDLPPRGHIGEEDVMSSVVVKEDSLYYKTSSYHDIGLDGFEFPLNGEIMLFIDEDPDRIITSSYSVRWGNNEELRDRDSLYRNDMKKVREALPEMRRK